MKRKCENCGRPVRTNYCFYCGTGEPPERRKDGEEYARKLWSEAVPIAGTLASYYLREHRRIELLPPNVDGVLRFHPQCPFGDSKLTAMVALLRDVRTNQPRGIHRTPIDRVAGKLAAPRVAGAFSGAAIKLWPGPAAGRLTVGEGIETTLSAVQLVPAWAPAWAVGTAANIGGFPVLDEVTEIHVLADRDSKKSGRVGQVNAWQCADRYDAFGIAATVHTPRRHKDFNDILREMRREG